MAMTNILRKPFRYRYDNVVLILIGLNLLVFLGQNIFPQATAYLSLNTQLVLRYGMVWQFFTYMFAHGGISHLLLNMLGLFFFGTPVERQMGSKEFLLFYLTTGFFAGLFSFGLYWATGSGYVFLLGASGALFAVQLAYATFFPDSIVYLWGILPLRAPIMVLGFTALELFSSIFGLASGIAHITHLAGFGFAWLYFVIRYGANPWHYLRSR
ncbi:rhomboid family intramembrane serine protease [Gracilinema caldarium]|uniref:Peptidase S54, rhomboid domain protein n=1 Tax=Gracilinema caldarium (strain ATCC 51460 / DSM 7334 / H1) TaxID=744872 RepID=F8EWU2_GRAC1|nr:rhomboid family intramembrane serine protease [Gracilinema caldarium]AEJ18328.1 Peptidase S54, rhomboid domain protein [Gracilinema caldarium DSM 7334]